MATSTTNFTTTTLRSDELSCPSCIKKIENALTALDGVSSAEVKFASGRILVTHDPQVADVASLVAAVSSVGYSARPAAY